MENKEKQFYQKWWVWVLIVLAVLWVLGIFASQSPSKSTGETTNERVEADPEWVEVFEMSANTTKQSESFRLQGGQQRVSYSVGTGNFVSCTIYVEQDGHDITTQGGFPVVMGAESGSSDNTILRKKSGEYYVHVIVANNGPCDIKIEELR